MASNLSALIDAIPNRRSQRNFQLTFLPDETLQQLTQFLTSFTPPFDNTVSTSIHTNLETTKIAYFQTPPHFLALSATNSLEDQAKLGFIGEIFLLYCESLGIETCWLGHFSRNKVMKIINTTQSIPSDQHLFCIILFGYGLEKPSLINRLSLRLFAKKDRPLSYFILQATIKDIPEPITHALSLASKAPSAMNSQKWQYILAVQETEYIIKIQKQLNYRHLKWRYYNIDVGTAAAHCWLGLQQSYSPKLQISTHQDSVCWQFTIEQDLNLSK